MQKVITFICFVAQNLAELEKKTHEVILDNNLIENIPFLNKMVFSNLDPSGKINSFGVFKKERKAIRKYFSLKKLKGRHLLRSFCEKTKTIF